MHKIVLAAFAASAFAAAAPVAASDTVTIKVDYGDLDLSRTDQVDVLKTRIAAAAKTACRTRSPLYSGWSSVDESCVAQATSAALDVAQSRIPAEVALAH